MAGKIVDNITKDIARKNVGTTNSALLFWMSATLVAFGVVFFVEDTSSSYYGIKAIESYFNIRFAALGTATYILGSLFFQVGTMLAMFAYLTDHNKYAKASIIALIFQLIDFAADVWYRSDGGTGGPAAWAVSAVLTFVFFTVGSEFALALGLAFLRYTIVDGLEQTIKIIVTFFYAAINAISTMKSVWEDRWNELNEKENRKPQEQQRKPEQPKPQQQGNGMMRQPTMAKNTTDEIQRSIAEARKVEGQRRQEGGMRVVTPANFPDIKEE